MNRSVRGAKGSGDKDSYASLSKAVPKRSHRSKQPMQEEPLFQRPVLVDSVSSSLEHDGLVVFCSDPGLGRRSLAKLVCRAYEDDGISTRWLRLNVKSDGVAIRRITQAISAFVQDEVAPLGEPLALLVIDGLSIKSEDFAVRLGKLVTGALLAGLRIIVILSPEYEFIVDEFPRCRVFAAHDLVLKPREIKRLCGKKQGGSSELILQSTHGIAPLVAAMCVPGANEALEPGSSLWEERACHLYASALRPALIEEELLLRCAMLAYGSGSFEDLQLVGIRAPFDLLADTRAVCPLFGIDIENRTFNCVAVGLDSLRELLITAAGASAVDSEELYMLISRIARRLVANGAFDRAGALLWANPLDESAASCVSSYPLELIDAGHLPLVAHVSMRVDGEKLLPARRMLRILGVPIAFSEGERNRSLLSMHCSSRVLLHIELLESIERLKRSRPLDEVDADLVALAPRVKGSQGTLASKVYQHYRALALWFSGSALEAFRELMLGRELREQDEKVPSLFSSLLQSDFEALRRVIGDPISVTEAALLREAKLVLEASRAPAMRNDAIALLELAGMVSGECRVPEASTRAIVRWQSGGKSRVVAWASLLASLLDSSHKQFRKGFVRANQSLDSCEVIDETDVRGFAWLARETAISGLGESLSVDTARREEVVSESSPDIGAAIKLYAAVVMRDDDLAGQTALQMRNIVPRMETVAILSLAMRASGALGSQLAAFLPVTWRGRAGLAAPAFPGSPCGVRAEADASPIPVLRIGVFGGITISLGDELVPESAWRRKQAKVLLAILALTPGHLMQRHEIISALWPDVDLARGREYLYTVLSSLRTSLGQTSSSNQYILGEMGQIRLDSAIVSCDVDEFESIARRIVTRGTGDEEIVSLCLSLESLYAGGSFVPASDALGSFKHRHDELASRYKDAMMAGAEAAARLRDPRQAAWFTRAAKAIA